MPKIAWWRLGAVLLLVSAGAGLVAVLSPRAPTPSPATPPLAPTATRPPLVSPATPPFAPTATRPPLVSLLTPSPGPPAPSRPRLWLDPPTLARLRLQAAAGTPQWATLQAQCDRYLDGRVEYPDGNDYPDGGSIGEGYQGDGYRDPLLNIGLCYQIAHAVAPGTALAYGAKGAALLDKMSDPPSSPHWACPLRDNGYGIRNYGVGLALGYDWLYDALPPALRTKVYTALNHWLDWFEHGGACPDGPQQDGGFGREHPLGNYFAGYYAAKGLAALATAGDNPLAPAQWDDWRTRLHGQMVQPYYAAHLAGGGWPEGWNYGPLATVNMLWPVLAAQTAQGIDLVHDAAAPFPFPQDQGLNLIHFSWPNRLSLDDRGALYGANNPAATPATLYSVLAGLLTTWNEPAAPLVHRFAREVRTVQGARGPPWQDLLFWDDSAPEQDFATLPLSYLARGMETAAMRSSWQTDAVWGSFTSGPYVDYPGAGEQYFDQGSLAIVRGGQPLLANAVGALLRNTPGSDDGSSYEGRIYDDLFGNNDADPTLGNRTLFNVFYVRAGHYGQIAASPDEVHTRISQFADGGAYVYLRGADLADMYRRAADSATPLIGAWTREVVYLRPRIFVLYDRTTVPDPNAEQWMAWHLAGVPAAVAPPSGGTRRFDVNAGAAFAGAVTTLLPDSSTTTLVNVFTSNKVYRLEVRPGVAASDQRWLTVFDAAATSDTVARAVRLSLADGNVQSGAVLGVVLREVPTNQVVLFGAGPANEAVSGPIRYVVPTAPTAHLLANLPPETGYAVSVVTAGGNQTITITPGNGFTSTAEGVLYLTTTAQGDVAAGR